jgi:hypothetical protein
MLKIIISLLSAVFLLTHAAFADEEPLLTEGARSASGAYVLSWSGFHAPHVTAMGSDGIRKKGSSTIALSKNGQPVWTQQREFTLCDARVTDAGQAVAFAYDHGHDGFDQESPGDDGNLLVLFFDTNGSILNRHAFDRKSAGWTSNPPPDPFPVAEGFILAEASDRVILRVRLSYKFARKNRLERVNQEQWWSFKISDGSLIEQITPEHLSPEMPAPGVWRIVRESVISDTSLVLVHEVHTATSREGIPGDARLSVLDLHGKRIWLHDFDREYLLLDEGGRIMTKHAELVAQVTMKKGGFSFHSLAADETYAFTIEKADDETGTRVVEWDASGSHTDAADRP